MYILNFILHYTVYTQSFVNLSATNKPQELPRKAVSKLGAISESDRDLVPMPDVSAESEAEASQSSQLQAWCLLVVFRSVPLKIRLFFSSPLKTWFLNFERVNAKLKSESRSLFHTKMAVGKPWPNTKKLSVYPLKVKLRRCSLSICIAFVELWCPVKSFICLKPRAVGETWYPETVFSVEMEKPNNSSRWNQYR